MIADLLRDMRCSMNIAALIAASATAALGAQLINGNWYGQAVARIIYTDWGQAGTYQKVTDMSNGQCQMESVSYSGGTSPLDGEVSWHFRGPMHLKQFAFYTPSTSSSLPGLKMSTTWRRNSHGHQDRAIGDMVTATINGVVVTWVNEYGGQPTRALPSCSSAAAAPVPRPTYNGPAPAANAGAGNWARQAYYNAANGTAEGLVFLNTLGGQGSGVFDYAMGNSLSYASFDCKSGSASPQILADILLDDNTEAIIYSDKPCSGNDCGAYRPGTVAYHGFDGETKMFLLEFDMPISGKTGFNMDMPAVWMLNAAIPRTQQYGGCSCWKSGCGEWDIFEVLDSGNTRAKSTLHAGRASGGESDYFTRPVDKTMKAAVIFDGHDSSGHIVVLPDDTSFVTVLADSTVQGFGWTSLVQNSTKIFRLGPFSA